MKPFVVAVAALKLSLAVAAPALAQQLDSTKCDSILAAAKAGQVETGLFLSADRADGGVLSDRHSTSIVLNVGAAFTAPKPFRLNVFNGPPLLRTLRSVSADTATGLRSPSVVGVYRVSSRVGDSAVKVQILRESLVPGFDSAAVEAIRTTRMIEGVLLPPVGEDSMRFDIRFTTDSLPDSRRLVTAMFPQMRITDAVPLRGNPPAVYPASALPDSLAGEVVLRFVVARNGTPVMSTLEVIRATAYDFLRPSVEAVARQRFKPAMVRGCPIAQVVDYPFSFNPPQSAPRQ